MYLLFAAMAGYVIAKRPQCLAKTWLQPLPLAVYIFFSLAFLMESFHPYVYYREIFRTVQTFAGSLFLASLCRDRNALGVAMYGYVLAGAFMSIVLLLTSYGALSGATAVDYAEADLIRSEVFEEMPLEYDLNNMAFITAQGGGVALALALTTRAGWSRYLFFGISLACCLASFLPMSRSGIATVVIVCASVMFGYGLNRIKTLAIGILIAATMMIFVPQAIWSRLAFPTEVDRLGRMEGRALVYTAFVNHLPEFAVAGVGAGNFWRGALPGYRRFAGSVSGAHNVFFQTLIYWGLPAFFGLIAIIFQTYRCLPGRYSDDGLALGLLAVSMSLLLLLLSVHTLYAKEFSVGIGLLLGANRWIWQAHTVLRMRPKQPTTSRSPLLHNRGKDSSSGMLPERLGVSSFSNSTKDHC
jgi:hypothetical protein